MGLLMKLIERKQSKDIRVSEFYVMLRHYDVRSTNIAVIKDKKAYKNLIKHFRKNINPVRDDKEIVVDENKHIFIIDDIDRTIAYIDDVWELENIDISFSRYM